MSDKNSSNPLSGWFEASLGLVTEQINTANKQIQQKMAQSQQMFDELSERGGAVESQLMKAISPEQWLSLWKNAPLAQWMPDFTPVAQKRAAKLDLLSSKIDVLVEQVATLATKRAAEKAKTTSVKQPTAKKAPRMRATTKSTKVSTTTRKRSTAKPATKAAVESKDATDE